MALIIVTTRSSQVNMVTVAYDVGEAGRCARQPPKILSDASRQGMYVMDGHVILVSLDTALTSFADPLLAELAKELDGLPLALATAGAYLDQVSTSFADYLRLYKASWLKLQQTSPDTEHLRRPSTVFHMAAVIRPH
jgi:hypothetical protein